MLRKLNSNLQIHLITYLGLMFSKLQVAWLFSFGLPLLFPPPYPPGTPPLPPSYSPYITMWCLFCISSPTEDSSPQLVPSDDTFGTYCRRQRLQRTEGRGYWEQNTEVTEDWRQRLLRTEDRGYIGQMTMVHTWDWNLLNHAEWCVWAFLLCHLVGW